ncbi:MAG: hypothetical protein KBF78_17240 [Fuscovulum sp.]|nr:hypothetical protein [Fuscovulum sp.]
MGDANNNPKPSGRPQVLYFNGRGFAVVDAWGRPLTGFYGCRQNATEKLETLRAEADAKAKRMKRPCMCCGQEFQSEGIHNRLCDPCRHRDVAPDPFKSAASRPRRAA